MKLLMYLFDTLYLLSNYTIAKACLLLSNKG